MDQPDDMIVWRREAGDGWIGSVLGQPVYRMWFDRERSFRWQLGFWCRDDPVEWRTVASQWCNREWSRGRAESYLKDRARDHFRTYVLPGLVLRLKESAK